MRGRNAAELADDIELRVAHLELSPGDRLPPVRVLAAELDLAPNTVAAAYRRLGERGIAIGRGRMGTFITERPPTMIATDPMVRDGLLNLASGNPDPDLLPDLNDALRASGGSTILYGDRSIDEGLAEQATRLLAADGVSTDHLTVVSGGLDGMERVLQAHLRRGDRVAVEDPSYPPVIDLAGALGLVAVPMAIDDEGPRPESFDGALTSGAVAVVVTPRSQNPFGSAVSADRASILRSMLGEFPNVLVIEDDHAAAVSGSPMHSIATDREHWATIRSAAKTYGPDVRLALLAGDATTVRRVEGRQRLGPGWVSHVLQRLVARMMQDPDVNQKVARAAGLYASRRRAMLDALRAVGLEAHGASGLNVWVPVPDESVAVRTMEEQGIAIRAGSRSRIGSAPGVRLTVASLDESEASDVAAALHRAVSELGPGTRSG
jgi:DNA-binding transcriptional MocR family regulator